MHVCDFMCQTAISCVGSVGVHSAPGLPCVRMVRSIAAFHIRNYCSRHQSAHSSDWFMYGRLTHLAPAGAMRVGDNFTISGFGEPLSTGRGQF